jgi:hypothetical protein
MHYYLRRIQALHNVALTERYAGVSPGRLVALATPQERENFLIPSLNE